MIHSTTRELQATYNDIKEYTMNFEQVTIFDLKPVQPISKARSGKKATSMYQSEKIGLELQINCILL